MPSDGSLTLPAHATQYSLNLGSYLQGLTETLSASSSASATGQAVSAGDMGSHGDGGLGNIAEVEESTSDHPLHGHLLQMVGSSL